LRDADAAHARVDKLTNKKRAEARFSLGLPTEGRRSDHSMIEATTPEPQKSAPKRAFSFLTAVGPVGVAAPEARDKITR